MPCVYILESLKSQLRYTGSSHANSGIERLKLHNAGKVKSTKSGRPWVIVREEFFATYTDARKRELFLKTGQGRKFIKEACPSGLRERS